MAVPMVAPSPNGTPQHPPTARVVSLLAPRVDRLAELRAAIRRLTDEERALTSEVVVAMDAQGLRSVHGRMGVAVMDHRTTLKTDAALFHEALGTSAFTAMSVSVTAARRLMGESDLAAISESATTKVLRIEPIPA